jgi:hypothetical protein
MCRNGTGSTPSDFRAGSSLSRSNLVHAGTGTASPVVWVEHSDDEIIRGSDGWRIVPELAPGAAEPLVEKDYGDSFEATTLETVLSQLAVGRLVVVGAETGACVRSTLHGAFVRGYDAAQRCPHDRRQVGMGRAPAGSSRRTYESVLALPDRAGPHRGHDDHGSRRLRRLGATCKYA